MQLGYEKTPNDWERIAFNRKLQEEKYLGQVIQAAYQCRIRKVKVVVAPWMTHNSPPDMLIGDEHVWTYVTGSQILSHKILKKLAATAHNANKLLAFITKGENPREKNAAACLKLGIHARFAELFRMFHNTREMHNGNIIREYEKIWIQEV